jgi:hypothetical protein
MSDVDPTNALAAEYVLGTLDSDEREQARALLAADTAFAVQVTRWERRLGELHLMVEPVEPDAGIWTRIKSKVPDVQQRSSVRLPEAHIPEPAPAVIPIEAPSLDAIEATISETAAVLTLEAAAVPASEPTEVPVSEPITPITQSAWEVMPAPASEPTAEVAPIPIPDAAPPPDLDAFPVPGLPESAPLPEVAATLDASPGPAWHAAASPAALVEPVPAPPVVPPALSAEVIPTPGMTRRLDEALRQVAVARRGMRRWRAFAILMTLVVAAVAGLLAAWKFAPERVPPQLQPFELLRHVGVTPPASTFQLRRPILPPSRYEE